MRSRCAEADCQISGSIVAVMEENGRPVTIGGYRSYKLPCRLGEPK
jgi:hypothetical protein